MKLLLTPAVAALLFSLPTPAPQASDFGLFAGWSTWQQNYTGDFNSVTSAISVDVEDDLAFDDERNISFYAAVEHPLPAMPNLKFTRTQMEISRNGRLQREIDFNDTTFAANTSIHSRVDLSHTDVTAYWQPVQHWLTVGLGFTVRLYDSRIVVQSRAESDVRAKEELEHRLPMAYGRALIEIPNTGFSVGAEVHGVTYDGSNLLDTRLELAYQSIFGFGAMLGWRSFQMELDDIDDIDTDIGVSGVYLGITYRF